MRISAGRFPFKETPFLLANRNTTSFPWASGAAYTYERESDDGSEWTEIRKLVPSDPSSLDYFGSSVALGDQFAFIGVPQDDDVGYISGSAVVFALSYSRPWVSGVTSTPPPPDGVLTEGDWSAVGITDLHVTFSEQMRTSDDPAEPGIVTDASNWLLVQCGFGWPDTNRLVIPWPCTRRHCVGPEWTRVQQPNANAVTPRQRRHTTHQWALRFVRVWNAPVEHPGSVGR
jgi:hypothetical protein